MNVEMIGVTNLFDLLDFEGNGEMSAESLSVIVIVRYEK